MSDSVKKYHDLLEAGWVSTSTDDYSNDPIVEAIKYEFTQRSRRGQLKYKTTLAENKLNSIEWLQHLKEELMDSVCYIQRLIVQLKLEKNEK